MSLLVPAYPGCPGSKAVKRSLLLLFVECSNLPSEVLSRSIICSTGWVCQDCRSTCRSKIAEIQCTQAEMAEKLSDTFVSLAYLQDEVQQLKTHSSIDVSKTGSSTGAGQSVGIPAGNQGDISTNVPTAVTESTVLNTLTDREQRKQNLVITGLPESGNDDDVEQAEYLFVKICEEHLNLKQVVKVVMCSRGGGSASEVETHKNIDSVLHTKTTFQAHSIFSVSIQK